MSSDRSPELGNLRSSLQHRSAAQNHVIPSAARLCTSLKQAQSVRAMPASACGASTGAGHSAYTFIHLHHHANTGILGACALAVHDGLLGSIRRTAAPQASPSVQGAKVLKDHCFKLFSADLVLPCGQRASVLTDTAKPHGVFKRICHVFDCEPVAVVYASIMTCAPWPSK